MRMSLPSIIRGDGATLFEVRGAASGGQFVLFLYIDFNIKKHDVHGFIALIMDLPSIVALKDIVHDFISGIEKRPSDHVG
jgi:chemotaxis protein CheC